MDRLENNSLTCFAPVSELQCPAPVPRWGWLALLMIVLLGLGLRMGHYRAIAPPVAYVDLPTLATGTDMYYFWEWAGRIVETGDWWQRDTYHPRDRDPQYDSAGWNRRFGGKAIFNWEPLYPYTLALLRKLGLAPGNVILLQLLLASLTPVVVFLLARWFVSVPGALLAAFITALYGPLLANQGQMLRDWIQPLTEPLILLGLLWAVSRGGWWRYLLAGMALGMCILSKSTILLFLPLGLLWLVWAHRGWGRAALPAAVWVLGVSLAFSPLCVRNLVAGAPPLAINNRVAVNLVCANAADGDPVAYCEPPALEPILDKAQGSAWIALIETLKTHQNNWSGLLRFQWWKLRAFLDSFEVSSNLSYHYVREISPVLQVLPTWSVLLPLAGVGLGLVALPRWRLHLPLLLFFLAFMTAFLAGMAVSRFRLPLVPVLAIWAAAGLEYLGWGWKARRPLVMLGWVGVLGAMVLVQQSLAPRAYLRNQASLMVHLLEYGNCARHYLDQKRFPEALAEMERAAARCQGHPQWKSTSDAITQFQMGTHLQYGVWLLKQRHIPEARVQLQRAHRLGSLYPREFPELDWDFATLFVQTQDLPTAIQLLEQFIQTHPQHPKLAQAQTLLEQIQAAVKQPPAP